MNAALKPLADPALEPARKRLLSVVDYYRMAEVGILGPEERVELIEGVIVTMPPAGPARAHLVDELTRRLVVAVGDRAVVRVQNPVRLSDLSESEPDLALLRPREGGYATAHPMPADTLLAIEVSDSTLAQDRRVKAPLYARHGIPELWLVDVKRRRLVVYGDPHEDGYRSQVEKQPLGTLAPAAIEDLSIDLSNLFAAG